MLRATNLPREAMVQVEEVIAGAAPSVAVVRTAGGKVQDEVAVPLERGVQLLTADGRPAPRPRAMRLDTLKDQVRAHAARIVR